VLILASAAPLWIEDRGWQASLTMALHLLATAAFVVVAAASLRGRFRPGAVEAFGVGLVLLLLALALPPQLSDDVYRYVFEGKMVAAGINPYLHAPDAAALVPLRDACWLLINHKEVPAAYPPAVQLLAAAAVRVAPSPLGPKLAFGACALVTFAALWRYLPALGLPATRAVLFGWCPLVWLESAGEGHGDALAALFTVLALWASTAARPLVAGGALAVATAGKLLPVVLLPFLARRGGRAYAGFALVLAALYAPFAAAGSGLFTGTLEYAARWRANDSAFALVYWLTETVMAPWRSGTGYSGWLAGLEVQRVAKLPLLALGLGVLWRCWRRQESPERTAFVFFVFFVAASPTLHPWYVVLLVPWLCVQPNLGLLAFTGTVTLAYHVLPTFHATGVWQERVWVKVLEYVPFYAGLLG